MNAREPRKTSVVLLMAAFLLGWETGHAAEAQTVTVLVAYHSVSGNTEKMAQGVADGAKAVSGTKVILKRVGDVATDDLLSSDAVIVGSPVYFGNMSGEVKTFFDNWLLKFGVFSEFKMRNKVGGAFTTGAAVSNGKELTMLSILEAMLVNQMVVIGGGGAFGEARPLAPTRRESTTRKWQPLAI